MSGSNPNPRLKSMTLQQELIEKKKAEILKQQKLKESQSSSSSFQSSPNDPGSNSPSLTSATKRKGPNLKNRWGFKGKKCKTAESSNQPSENDVELKLSEVAEKLASLIAISGDELEIQIRERNKEVKELNFLHEKETSPIYKLFREKVISLRKGIIDEAVSTRKNRKKKSRWGEETPETPSVTAAVNMSNRKPEVFAYAIKVFGSIDLESHQWKQCEDQIKMNSVYQDILDKQKLNEKLKSEGKVKYEYDSDEDTEGGTWEHKRRQKEMDKTFDEAQKLTHDSANKHHIGDFLPPEELNKFMAKYQALKNGETLDGLDEEYATNKLTEENKGFKLLQKMGWSEGAGLGTSGQGIKAPISSSSQGSEKQGLGVTKTHDLKEDDDEFDAYRKRMMMAYRFRPNPLNNPRRSYY